MMIDIGITLLQVGFVAAIWATAAGLYSALRDAGPYKDSAERALHLGTITSIVASGILVDRLLARDYSLAYVWSYTSNTLEDLYAATALWAGQEGSLLLWLAVLGVIASIAVLINRKKNPLLTSHAVWVLASIQLFFFVLLTTVASPFALLSEKYPESIGQVIMDGNGLNPMLQNIGMVIHPPLLYFGYVGFAIPFAFAIAALVSGKLTPEWLKITRFWTIASWAFLSLGILAGAKWAYVELGWGGYWAWDPVENASFMPWLTGTAFLHSAMIEERRGMLRRWNMFLVMLTFLLSIFGTFLTRSGIIQSVHSFAQSGVGDIFVYYMAAWIIVGAGILSWRWKDLGGRYVIESLLSREAFFLFQNLILLGICGAVMWGTMYPVISEAMTGVKITVAAPYFNRVIVPLGLALFLLTGAGPMIAWRRASASSLRRNLGLPLLAGAIVAGIAWFLGSRDFYAVNAFALAAFVIASITMDIFLCGRARQHQTKEGFFLSAFILMDRNRRRYGGFLVHVGMAVLLIGLAGNAFTEEIEKPMKIGETVSLGEYEVALLKITSEDEEHREALKAEMRISRNGAVIGEKTPEISVYFPGTEREQRNSEVAIRSTISHDLYLIFAEPIEGGALIRVMIHPLVGFVWSGGLLAVVGALMALVSWKLPFLKKNLAATANEAVVSSALLLMIVTASGASAQPYSKAIGDRDPVSKDLICLCGCRMILETCDHPHCSGCSKELGALAELRARGLGDDEILDEMISAFGQEVLAAPPAEGGHLIAWILPFGAVAAAGGLIVVWHRRRRAPMAEPTPLGDEDVKEIEAKLREREL